MPVLVVIQGRHHPDAADAYSAYTEASVPLLRRYGAGIEAVGPGLARPEATETWPVNIVLSFPDASAADGLFNDPEYVQIKEAHRDRAYAELHLAVISASGPVGPASPGVLAVTQAEVADPGALAVYQSASRPLAARHGVSVLGAGPGLDRPYATAAWPLTLLLGFADEAALNAYAADPGAQALTALRQRAYGRHRSCFSLPRPPRVQL